MDSDHELNVDGKSKNREIQRYFLVLIVIALLSIPLVAIFISLSQAGEAALRDRMESFHLRSAMLSVEATTRVADLRREIYDLSEDSKDSVGSNRDIDIVVYSIGQSVDSIVHLHGVWLDQGDQHSASVERLARQHEDLRDVTSQAVLDIEDVVSSIDAFALTLFQLERLHSLTTEESFALIETTRTKTRGRVAVFMSLVLIVVGLIMTRLMSLLRARLREQERLERELINQERQLQQSRKLEALGTLVGGVAHDFNNLLTLILGHTETALLGTSPTDPRHESLLQVKNAGERSAALTKQLLAFSHQQSIDAVVLDLNQSIRDAELMIRRLIRVDIELVLELAPSESFVTIDPVQWELLLINLAVNAQDAMPGGGRLTVETFQAPAADSDGACPKTSTEGLVCIRVVDTGYGMTPETLSRVFDPFFTTKGLGKGTGLGLATVHGAVTQAGGSVRVESEVGYGTCFEILLPMCGKPDAVARAETPSPAIPRGSETVLLAEDEPQVRALAAEHLRGAGYRVLEASDGETAHRLGSDPNQPVHLILSDVIMPGMSGPQMVERVLEHHPSARILLVSGYAEEELPRVVSGHVVHVLSKPYAAGDLVSTVRRILDSPELASTTLENHSSASSQA